MVTEKWIDELMYIRYSLLVKVNMKQSVSDGKYYIIQQSDYYQPEVRVLPTQIHALAFLLTRPKIHQGFAQLDCPSSRATRGLHEAGYRIRMCLEQFRVLVSTELRAERD